MLRLFFLLLTVLFLSSTDVDAGNPDLTPIPVLMENAKKALAEKDEKTLDSLKDQLFERITGFPASSSEFPEGLSYAEYEKRLCPYRKATASLFTPSRIQYLHHTARLRAYIFSFNKEGNAPNVRATIECVQDNGELVPEARALREGIAWIKKLHAASVDEVRAMVREYETLIELHPDDQMYQVLAQIVGKQIRDAHIDEETKKLSTEYMLFWGDIFRKADKGDHTAKLKVARHLQHLISQAEAAIARNDDEERSRIVDEIFVLTTGLNVWLKDLPKSLSAEDYEKRMCAYLKATSSLLTREEVELLRHRIRFGADVHIFKWRMEDEDVQFRMECVQDNGDPVPEAKALREGLAWAKRLDASDIAEAQAMAREYEALIKRYPYKNLYRWLETFISSHISDIRTRRLLKARDIKRSEGRYYRAWLARKANKGDVAVQLEMARRLETGDKFEQNTLFAYYWYKRAQQNNGGEAAQQGLDRLLPQLTEIDLTRIEYWLKKKYRMY